MLPPGNEGGVWLAGFWMPPAAITGAWAHAHAEASIRPQTIRCILTRFPISLIPQLTRTNAKSIEKCCACYAG
jgi:hypothetical protein